MTIKDWLDSEDRNYDEGVKLYAAHPTALRMLVVNLQRKQTAQMEEKLVYVLEKALAADNEGSTETLKKKGKSGAVKKASSPSQKPSKKAATPEPLPPMGDQVTEAEPPKAPSDEEE